MTRTPKAPRTAARLAALALLTSPAVALAQMPAAPPPSALPSPAPAPVADAPASAPVVDAPVVAPPVVAPPPVAPPPPVASPPIAPPVVAPAAASATVAISQQWAPPPVAPAPLLEPVAEGVSSGGLPRGWRGGLGLSTYAFSSGDEDAAGGGVDLDVSIGLSPRTFLDLRMPMGFNTGVAIGNPSFALRHAYVFSPSKAWLDLTVGLGLPILLEDSAFRPAYEGALVGRGLWDFQDFWPRAIPLRVGARTEIFGGSLVAFRAMLDLVLLPPVGDNDFELVTQHAVELQLGRITGGGLRVQGVALPTFDDTDVRSSFEGDLYQLAVEPFFSYQGEQLFARAGVLMPLDGLLGPAFIESWAYRLSAGFHID